MEGMQIRYFRLALCIALGVALGNALTDLYRWAWIGYVASAISQSFSGPPKTSQAGAPIDLNKTPVRLGTGLIESRENSARGKALQADCEQWRAQSSRMATEYVIEQTQQRCAAYERYRATGQ